jgi:hypothetical protein
MRTEVKTSVSVLEVELKLSIISQKGPFSKNAPPPTEKSLKKALIKSRTNLFMCTM